MKVDFSKKIKAIDGQTMKTPPLVDKDGKIVKEGIDADLKFVCLEALAAVLEDDKTATGADKVKNAALQIRIYESKAPIDLAADEVAFLKARIEKAIASAIVVYRVSNILEGKE